MALENKYITVAYKLYAIDNGTEDKEAIEECSAEHPFQFISKLGVVLPAFEAGVEGVEKDGAFDLAKMLMESLMMSLCLMSIRLYSVKTER